jgi:hypothetical protein
MKNASFWMQMWSTGAMVNKQFSICLRRYPFSSLLKNDRPVGMMTLGGTDERINSSKMVFMDMIGRRLKSGNGFYRVKISKIFINPAGGQRLGGDNPDIDFSKALLLEDDHRMMNRLGVVMDSGTTDTILAQELKPKFDRAWESITGNKFPDQDIDLSADQLRKWPTIVFEMKGSSGNALVAFPPSSYMALDFSTGRYKPSVWFHDKYGTSILGSNFMRSHNVLFDIENNRIGMAESDCDYNEIVTGKKSDFPDDYVTAEVVKQLLQSEHMQSLCENEGVTCLMQQVIRMLTIVSTAILIVVVLLEVCNRRKHGDINTYKKLGVVSTSSFDCEKDGVI